MCGGKPKKPEVQEIPKADPRPTITPSESSAAGQARSRNQRTRDYRSGFASTLKTGPQGVSDEKKQKLGQ